MPANVPRDEPLSVGEKEAVDVLLDKISEGHGDTDADWERQLLKAVERARAMYEDDAERFGDEKSNAFYHGLVTGYSVAMVMLGRDEESGE